MRLSQDTFIISERDPAISYLMEKDKRIAKLVSMIGEIECSVHNDDFKFLVEQIVGQLLSNKAAKTLNTKLFKLCDGTITPDKILTFTFDEINSLGISRQKVGYIINLAKIVNDGVFSFSELRNKSDKEIMELLTSIKGIGNWTAKMYLLFVLRRNDILPYEDTAFLQAYKWLYKKSKVEKSEVIRKCRKWSPYSSYASRYLYRALDMGLTKEAFHLYK